jgi:CO/xanthine dehydrogenase Mo-binding subunit
LLFHYLIEGRGLGSALAEMDRSDRVRVIGPHINAGFGSAGDRQVMTVAVEAETASAGEELLWGFLEPRSQYAISTALRRRRKGRRNR